MNPEDISENFGVSHHWKNIKFENLGESQLKNGESRTHLGELQGSLITHKYQRLHEYSIALSNL